jgi:DNA (cytosine-5)-methyltransferase 1
MRHKPMENDEVDNHPMMRLKRPTVVSLFAGAGGMDLGFQQAGFDIIWTNEIDPDAVKTYSDNVGNQVVLGDIRTVESDSIPACDVVIGGPPCQGFSVAGKMNPDDPRSALLWEFVRVVGDKKPRAFMLENVKALGILERWAGVRRRLVTRLQGLGYDVAFGVLDASRFGVPQVRERVFFIGTARGDAESAFPEPGDRTVSVRDALRALPPYGQPGNDSMSRAIIVPAKRPVMRPSPYAGLLFNGRGRPINLDRPAPTLPAIMGGNRTPIIDQHALETGESNWAVEYHAHLRSGGKPYTSVPSRLRRLSVEECAVIQCFPAGFRFSGEQSSRYRQIGNALPPLLACAIATRLRSTLFDSSPPTRTSFRNDVAWCCARMSRFRKPHSPARELDV